MHTQHQEPSAAALIPAADTLGGTDCPALAGQGIAACGVRRATAAEAPRFHLGQARMTIGVSGSGRVLVNGTWQSLAVGQIYVTAPGTPHAHVADGPGSTAWLLWSPGMDLDPQEGGAWIINQGGPGIAAAIQGLLVGQRSGETVVMEAWARLIAGRARACLLDPDPRLARLWQAILEDLAAPWDLGRLAKAAGVCGEQLRRLSHHQHGASPKDLLTRVRMHRAATRLLDPAADLASVARSVGFSNQFNFSTAFKRILGISPSAWRQALGDAVPAPSTPPVPASGRFRRSG